MPEQRDGRDEGWRGDLKWGLKTFTTRLQWMVITLFLPEYLMGKAMWNRQNASDLLKKAKTLRLPDGTPLPQDELRNWTKTHAYFADMGGFIARTTSSRGDGLGSSLIHLSGDDILSFRQTGISKSLPAIHAHQIKDMSSADMFVKAAAVAQVTWMVIQAAARRAEALPVTQLEIEACAFAVQTLITYIIWWDRPQSIKWCVELELLAPKNADELLPLVLPYSNMMSFFRDYLIIDDRIDKPLRNSSALEISGDGWAFLGVLIGSLVIGGIQCVAWNYEFPTIYEKYLWRYSSIITIASPGSIGILVLIQAFHEFDMYKPKYIWVVVTVLYFFARLFTLFESVRSLFYLPPEAFIATWSTGIPHLA